MLQLQAEKSHAHGAQILSLAFSSDGKTIVSGSVDKIMKVWDAGALFPFPPVGLHQSDLTPSYAAMQQNKAESD